MIKWILILFCTGVLVADDYCKAYDFYENENLLESKKELDKLAFKDNLKAQNLLAIVNVEKNNASAAQKWFQNAAAKGNLNAAYNLGIYYFNIGKINQTKKWMQKAQDLDQAKIALGILYADTNVVKAKANFYIPATKGSKLAKSYLCVLPKNTKDRNNHKYNELCKGDIKNDYLRIGKFYMSPKKYGSSTKSIYYLKHAADLGDVEAMNLYGKMIYKRHGPSDESTALLYFDKASSLGNVDASVNAAWIYYMGGRWTRKPFLGLEKLNEALKSNNSQAQLYMGILMIKGYTFSFSTVQKDTKRGWAYIRKSAQQNNSEAMEYLINNGVQGDELKRYEQKLRKYYKDIDKNKELHFLYDGC